eukprot:gene1319-26728_t
MLTMLLESSTAGVLIGTLTTIEDEYGFSAFELAWIVIGAYQVGAVVTTVPASKGRGATLPRCLAGSCVAAASGLALFGAGVNFTMFFVAAFLIGVGVTVFYVMALTPVGMVFGIVVGTVFASIGCDADQGSSQGAEYGCGGAATTAAPADGGGGGCNAWRG